MNSIELKAIINHLERQLSPLKLINMNCQSCEHRQAGKCTVHNAVPPPEWVHSKTPVDCELWLWDEVPF